MRPIPAHLVGVLAVAFVVGAADGQLPRPPRKDLALDVRELPIPFAGYNQAYRDLIAFSKDGTLLATGAASKIVVWDVETRKVVTRMQMPEEQYAVNVAFTDDGKTLVSNGHDDPIVRFWDVKSGKQTREQPHANAPKEPLQRRGKSSEELGYRNPFLAFAPGAGRMAVLDKTNNFVELVDTASGAVKLKLDKAGYRGVCAFSTDGKLLVTSATFQKTLSIWNGQTGDLVRTLGEPTRGPVTQGGFGSVRFSHDGKYVSAYCEGTGRNDHYVCIWGVKDGLEYCRLPLWINPGEISPDGRVFIAASGGRFVLYDLLADRLIEGVKLPVQYFYHLQRSPDGLTLAFLGQASKGERQYSVYLAPFPTLGDDALPKGRLSQADLRDLWGGLSSSNLFRRRYVTGVFKAHPEQAVALVEDKVKPAAKADRERVLGLLKKLDDDEAERREAATKELRAEAFRFEPLLRETMKTSPAGEVRNRVTFVFNSIADQPTPPDLVSDLRGIELLESIATPAARKLLESLAGGASGRA